MTSTAGAMNALRSRVLRLSRQPQWCWEDAMLRICDTEILAPDQHQGVCKVKRQGKRDGKTKFDWRNMSYYPTLEAALHGRVMSYFEP